MEDRGNGGPTIKGRVEVGKGGAQVEEREGSQPVEERGTCSTVEVLQARVRTRLQSATSR